MSKTASTTYKPGISQVKAFTGSAANATALNAYTNIVRVLSDQDCFVDFEKAATTTTSMFIKAGIPEYFSVNEGNTAGATPSVISNGTNGNLFITEMTQ